MEHGKDAKLAANWIQGEFSARLNAEEKSVAEAPITGAQLGAMVTRIADNTLSSAGAKKVFEALWTGENNDVDAIIEAKGLKQVSDTGALESMVDEVLAGMPDQVAQYQNEEDPKKRKKMLGGFMGPLMKLPRARVTPSCSMRFLFASLAASIGVGHLVLALAFGLWGGVGLEPLPNTLQAHPCALLSGHPWPPTFLGRGSKPTLPDLFAIVR